MKINKEIHLKELIRNISSIWVYNDIKNKHYFSDDILEEDCDVSSQDEFLFYSDDQLKQLSSNEIREITNVELLDRIAKINIDKLSKEQINILKDVYKQKVIIDKNDVQCLLDKLKNCKRLFIAERQKNNDFLKKYNLYVDDCLSILHNLTVNDYVYSTKNYNLGHFGNNLIVFQPKNVKISKDKILTNVFIYIKIDLSESDDDMTVAISFHEANNK